MCNIEEILFKRGKYETKKATIEQLSASDIRSIKKDVYFKIVEKGGKGNRFRVVNDFRKGNNWNSLIEGLYISKPNGILFVEIYLQGASTDTSISEYFDTFFRSGSYSSSYNYLNLNIRYDEGEKVEVLRSFLLSYVYYTYSTEHKKTMIVANLKDYKIINPILNKYYDKYRLRYKNTGRYSGATEVSEVEGYHNAKYVLDEYIEENYKNLKKKTNEDLSIIYDEVFGNAMREFIKNFNYSEWCAKHPLRF